MRATTVLEMAIAGLRIVMILIIKTIHNVTVRVIPLSFQNPANSIHSNLKTSLPTAVAYPLYSVC